MTLRSASDSVKHICKNLGLSSDLTLLERVWEMEAGGLTKVARIIAIERSALVVEVTSAPALQELTLRRKELVRRINQHFAAPVLTQLTVRIASHG